MKKINYSQWGFNNRSDLLLCYVHECCLKIENGHRLVHSNISFSTTMCFLQTWLERNCKTIHGPPGPQLIFLGLARIRSLPGNVHLASPQILKFDSSIVKYLFCILLTMCAISLSKLGELDFKVEINRMQNLRQSFIRPLVIPLPLTTVTVNIWHLSLQTSNTW